MSKTVYIKLKQQYDAEDKKVLLKEICDIISYDKSVTEKIMEQEVYNYEDSFKNINPKRTYTAIVSAFHIIQIIKKVCGDDIEIVNLGETNTVVEYKESGDSTKFISFFKCVIACILIFFGAAFTIMAFNNDISINGIFEQFYFQMTGQEKPEFSELEIMYSIGLALGIIVFFNHFGNKKLSDDITPIEVELFKHKKDTLDTIVELKTNKKEEWAWIIW